MKVLIFGASGFVGPYLAREFAKYDYKVVGADVQVTDAMPFKYADILDAGSVERVIRETAPGMIVNLAAISSVGQSWNIPQKTVEVNVVGALNILEASRRAGKTPKILFVGSSEEYEASDKPINEKNPLDANNPYGISKMAQEKFAALYRTQYGMKVYCVRPFNHTGVGQRNTFVIPSWCKQVAGISESGKPGVIRVGNLEVKRDFSDVRDIVRAYRMILESDDCETIYNVGSGNAIDLRELLAYIVSLSEQRITVEVTPALIRPTDTQFICCDRTLIREKLGWEPEYTLFDTVKEMTMQYMKNNEKKAGNE